MRACVHDVREYCVRPGWHLMCASVFRCFVFLYRYSHYFVILSLKFRWNAEKLQTRKYCAISQRSKQTALWSTRMSCSMILLGVLCECRFFPRAVVSVCTHFICGTLNCHLFFAFIFSIWLQFVSMIVVKIVISDHISSHTSILIIGQNGFMFFHSNRFFFSWTRVHAFWWQNHVTFSQIDWIHDSTHDFA